MGLLTVLLGAGLVTAATAQQSQRSQQLASPDRPVQQSPAMPSGTSFSPFVGVEAGYDTNLDQRVQSRASHYEMVQAGANANWKPSANEAYSLYLRGRRFEFDQLDKSARYDLDVAVGARYDLSASTALKLGTSYNRDGISLFAPMETFGSFVELVNEGEQYRIRFNATSRTELSLKHGEHLDFLDPDVFDVTRAPAFDITKNGATMSLLLFRQNLIAPYVIGNYTNIAYIHQALDPAIDRNADEGWGVAGLRFSPNKDLYIDLGARRNRRDFDDREITSFTSTYFDGRFSWKPTSSLLIRGVVERQLKEPTTLFGLADDVRTYELVVEKKFGDWFFYARGFLDKITPIGENFTFDKYNWATGLRYDLGNQVELYTDYAGKLVKEHVEGDEFERHRISSGVRMKF